MATGIATESSNIRPLFSNVNPRTGSVDFAIDIGSLPATYSGEQDFNLRLLYTGGNSPMDSNWFSGNWSMNISKIHKSFEHITLKDGTVREMVLQNSIPNLVYDKVFKVKFYKETLNGFDYIKAWYADGTLEYFKFRTVLQPMLLTRRVNPSGKQYDFTYNSQDQLTKVQCSDGNYIEVAYNTQGTENRFEFHIEDHSYTVLCKLKNNINMTFLEEVVLRDNTDYSYKFEYDEIANNQAFLTKISTPTGEVKSFTYSRVKYTDEISVPVVSKFSSTLTGESGSSHEVNYEYYETNFTGWSEGYEQTPGQDGCIRRTDNYKYKTKEKHAEYEILRTYNRFHLLVNEEVSLVALPNSMDTDTTYTYQDVDGKDITGQPVQFSLPTKIESIYTDSSKNRVITTTLKHDNCGNVLEKNDGIQKVVTEYYSPSSSVEDGCPPNEHGFINHVKSITESASGESSNTPERKMEYTYSLLEGLEYFPAESSSKIKMNFTAPLTFKINGIKAESYEYFSFKDLKDGLSYIIGTEKKKILESLNADYGGLTIETLITLQGKGELYINQVTFESNETSSPETTVSERKVFDVSRGIITQKISPLGKVTDLTYDDYQRLTRVSIGNVDIATYVYEDPKQIGSVYGTSIKVIEDGYATKKVYDGYNRLKLECYLLFGREIVVAEYYYKGATNVVIKEVNYDYDSSGVLFVKVEESFDYKCGFLVSEKSPQKGNVTYEHKIGSNTVTTKSETIEVTHVKDNHDNVIEVNRGGAVIEQNVYDYRKKIIKTSNHRSESIEYTRDNFGRVIETKYSDGTVINYDYEAITINDINLITKITVKDDISTYTYTREYDHFGRLLSELSPNAESGSSETKYAYDSASSSLPKSIENGLMGARFTHDDENNEDRLRKCEGFSGLDVTNITYDQYDKITKIVSANGLGANNFSRSSYFDSIGNISRLETQYLDDRTYSYKFDRSLLDSYTISSDTPITGLVMRKAVDNASSLMSMLNIDEPLNKNDRVEVTYNDKDNKLETVTVNVSLKDEFSAYQNFKVEFDYSDRSASLNRLKVKLIKNSTIETQIFEQKIEFDGAFSIEQQNDSFPTVDYYEVIKYKYSGNPQSLIESSHTESGSGSGNKNYTNYYKTHGDYKFDSAETEHGKDVYLYNGDVPSSITTDSVSKNMTYFNSSVLESTDVGYFTYTDFNLPDMRLVTGDSSSVYEFFYYTPENKISSIQVGELAERRTTATYIDYHYGPDSLLIGETFSEVDISGRNEVYQTSFVYLEDVIIGRLIYRGSEPIAFEVYVKDLHQNVRAIITFTHGTSSPTFRYFKYSPYGHQEEIGV